ncbi:kinase-like domain-containing protein, partial [Parachaetomium inaequale]
LLTELAPLGAVRQYIMEHPDNPPPLPTRLQMALDVVTGVAYLHSKGVQHYDMSCRILFLFGGFRVKLGDFGASLLQGHDFAPTLCEESQYELPLRGRLFDDRPPAKRELFALGSAIFEITSWERPFQGLPDEEVELRYARDEFPSLIGNPAGWVIQKCWNEESETASEVLENLTQCLVTPNIHSRSRCPWPSEVDRLCQGLAEPELYALGLLGPFATTELLGQREADQRS